MFLEAQIIFTIGFSFPRQQARSSLGLFEAASVGGSPAEAGVAVTHHGNKDLLPYSLTKTSENKYV